MNDTIRLAGLEFFAVVGDLPHERQSPQPLSIDVEVTTDTRSAVRSDRLRDGLDYRLVYEVVARVVGGPPEAAPRLLETLCARIADEVLDLAGVEACRVRCRKPWAALPGPARWVEVEIGRP